MKKNKLIILLSLPVLCLSLITSCYQGEYDTEEEYSSSESSEDIVEIYYPLIDRSNYNEEPDSLEGLSEDEIKDLSGLVNAISSIGNNYTKETQVYFNKLAVERVNAIYDTTFVQRITTLFSGRAMYAYDEAGYFEEGYVSKVGENTTYKVNLTGETIEEKLTSVISNENLLEIKNDIGIEDLLFTIHDIDQKFIDDHGPITVEYSSTFSVDYEGWTRISDNKYKCDRVEVITKFLELVSPGFTNGGSYMTFSHVTVELDVDENTPLRFRLYASSTQSGKMLEEHLDKENRPNWYLLFAEANIKNVNLTSIIPLENYSVN